MIVMKFFYIISKKHLLHNHKIVVVSKALMIIHFDVNKVKISNHKVGNSNFE